MGSDALCAISRYLVEELSVNVSFLLFHRLYEAVSVYDTPLIAELEPQISSCCTSVTPSEKFSIQTRAPKTIDKNNQEKKPKSLKKNQRAKKQAKELLRNAANRWSAVSRSRHKFVTSLNIITGGKQLLKRACC